MKNSVRMAALPCLGSCIAATIVEYFRHPGVWGAGEVLWNFFLTYIITTTIVSFAIWVWMRIKQKR